LGGVGHGTSGSVEGGGVGSVVGGRVVGGVEFVVVVVDAVDIAGRMVVPVIRSPFFVCVAGIFRVAIWMLVGVGVPAFIDVVRVVGGVDDVGRELEVDDLIPGGLVTPEPVETDPAPWGPPVAEGLVADESDGARGFLEWVAGRAVLASLVGAGNLGADVDCHVTPPPMA
jgi:hypothetical protein